MDLTGSVQARIRWENVCVSQQEFLEVWDRAGQGGVELAQLTNDWHDQAVAQTCRWLAAVPMRTALCEGMTRSPVTGRACLASRDVIEAEWNAACRGGFTADLAVRRSWSDAVVATLRWAWRGQAPVPVLANATARPN